MARVTGIEPAESGFGGPTLPSSTRMMWGLRLLSPSVHVFIMPMLSSGSGTPSGTRTLSCVVESDAAYP